MANREFRYPRRARHNIVDALEMEWYFANIHRILVKVEQRFFHRQMTLGHIRLLTASCEGGLSNTCGRQGENAKRFLPADQKTSVVRVRVESGGTV